ncbi:hypothetical protein [Actinocrispum sp. NPDC049592]|uniref:sunset domain-containing protein n=1 Tax=Actinocrispum sp. NPDC049592 TaxID=3154835 RepID=UPI00343A6179
MLWLAAQTYLLCLVSFIAGVVITAVVLRKRRPAQAEDTSVLDAVEDEDEEDEPEPMIIKGSRKSMRYHTPDSPYYGRLKGDVIFESVAEAEKAGYSAWKTPART